MKTLFLALLFSLTAFAEAPPVSVKGQNSGKLLPKWNLQVPNSSVTSMGGIDALIETGNTNLLANPGFEGAPFMTGWGCSNFSCVSTTLYFSDGKQGVTVTNANTVNTVVEQSVTPSFPTAGRTFQYGMFINTNVAGFQLCSLFNGAEQGCTDVPALSTTTFVLAPIFQPSTSGTVGIRLKSINASAKQVFFDGAYVGTVVLGTGYAGSASTLWTPTFVGFGTVASPECYWAQSNDMLLYDCKFTAGSSTATTASFSLPGTLTTASFASTRLSGVCAYSTAGGSATTPATFGVISAPNSNVLNFGYRDGTSGAFVLRTGSAMMNAGETMSCTGRVPIAGWGPLTAINSANSNYDWRPYVPATTQGFGTSTITSPYDCREKREGPDNLISCKFISGTTSAVEARIGVPYTIDPTKVPSIQLAGTMIENGAGAAAYNVLREPGVNYLTLGYQNGSTGGLTKQTGSSLFPSTTIVNIEARYPVLGWSENQNAPQLIGSVLGGTNITQHIFGAYGTGNATTVCAVAGACGVYNSSGNVTVTGGNNGNYNATVPAGTCSQPLTCTVNATNPTSTLITTNVSYQNGAVTPATTTNFYWYVNNTAGAAFNSYGTFTCDCVK